MWSFPFKTVDDEITEYLNDINLSYTQVLQTYDATGHVVNTYTYGVQRIQSEGETDETYLYDGHGSVSGVLDEKGEITTYAYTAYGDLLPDSPEPSVYGYNAEETDYTTGLQYLRARYYDTDTGRFIQKDEYKGDYTSPETLNRYTYCLGNPIKYNDPSGYIVCAVAVGTGVAISAETVMAAVTAAGVASLILIAGEEILDSIANLGDSISNALDTFVQKATEVWQNNKDVINGADINFGEIGAGIVGIISLGKALTTAVEKAKENKKEYPQNDPVHHIIAQTATLAKPAREVLWDVGISVQDPQNLIQIDKNLHKYLHTTAYYSSVNAIMSGFQAMGDALAAVSPTNKAEIKAATVRLGLQIIRTVIQIADKSVKAAETMR